jgi:potassium-transporting ATPase KdpC subunit
MKLIDRIPKSIRFLIWMTILTGIAYPLAITAFAQIFFPKKANGSIVYIDGQVRGSSLLAQNFESPRFFKARPSASDYAYIGSGASNLAATNGALAASVKANGDAWDKAWYGMPGEAVPPEMLYASASGLDPDISLEAALAQVAAVAAARGYTDTVKAALAEAIRASAAGSASLVGQPRVNVTILNVMLETNPGFAGSR